MSEKTVCIECGKRESDEHIGHAYRPAIWPLSGGAASEFHQLSDAEIDMKFIKQDTQLREIAEKWGLEYSTGKMRLDDAILRAMQEAVKPWQEELSKANLNYFNWINEAKHRIAQLRQRIRDLERITSATDDKLQHHPNCKSNFNPPLECNCIPAVMNTEDKPEWPDIIGSGDYKRTDDKLREIAEKCADSFYERYINQGQWIKGETITQGEFLAELKKQVLRAMQEWGDIQYEQGHDKYANEAKDPTYLELKEWRTRRTTL